MQQLNSLPLMNPQDIMIMLDISMKNIPEPLDSERFLFLLNIFF